MSMFYKDELLPVIETYITLFQNLWLTRFSPTCTLILHYFHVCIQQSDNFQVDYIMADLLVPICNGFYVDIHLF